MRHGILMFTKAVNWSKVGDLCGICLPESMVAEVWSLCHQSDSGGHQGIERRFSKFLKGFFVLSARQKISFLNGVCNTCLTKELSMPVQMGEHMPSFTGYVGEKLYADLVLMSETIRGNRYMLTAEDSFSRYCCAYPIPNKEAHTVAKVLMDQHFNVYRLSDQLHSDNRKEFVNNLWRELFSELKIENTTTLQYNPASNPVERFHCTLTAMLRTGGPDVQDNWDNWLNTIVFAYNCEQQYGSYATLRHVWT